MMTKVDKDQVTSVVTLRLRQESAFLREESMETPSLGVESRRSSFSKSDRTLTAMVCDGSFHCLSLTYVWRVISCPPLRSLGVAAPLYMRVFLPVSAADDELSAPVITNAGKIALVEFFGNLADVGLHASTMVPLRRTKFRFFDIFTCDFQPHQKNGSSYWAVLLAKFHFNKDQFADLMVINEITRTGSQMPSTLSRQIGPWKTESKLCFSNKPESVILASREYRECETTCYSTSEELISDAFSFPGKAQGCIRA
ncbi:hypothetical protein CDL15_Pgr014306 [Punica granatum]|uniref:Uncharacterized protein n=1 Tax=Punica granatum TaxID=22663 RepID=A0A218WDN0_PUNGR|nr:hypothetical protein CDL15_Pgr014306 [Punica granatum]